MVVLEVIFLLSKILIDPSVVKVSLITAISKINLNYSRSSI